MQIAQALAGYSLGDADNLRRAMGKKKAEEMAKERERFLKGVVEHKTADLKVAEAIFDQMETFAAYGFNKSHSAAYAVITYQTAYLKAHYRVEFLAGLLSLESGDADSTFKNFAECREHGIKVLAPDVNESRDDFTVVGDAIRFARRREARRLKAIEAVIGARVGRPIHEPARPARVRGQVEPEGAREPHRWRVRLDRAESRAAWQALDDASAGRRSARRGGEPADGLRGTRRNGRHHARRRCPPAIPERREELRHEREAIGFSSPPSARPIPERPASSRTSPSGRPHARLELPVANERPGRSPRPDRRVINSTKPATRRRATATPRSRWRTRKVSSK
jgi:hypothetical protein